jgi:hypothetical protein
LKFALAQQDQSLKRSAFICQVSEHRHFHARFEIIVNPIFDVLENFL